jgi:small subunit ribosomal protein S18
MAGKNAKLRGKNKDNSRRAKKKVSILTSEKVEYIDYKDGELLRRFTSDRAKIRARRVTGNDSQQQAAIAMAIKNAREMALLPYASRVTQQRSNRGERSERSQRADGPPPTPSAPPPGTEESHGDEHATDDQVAVSVGADAATADRGDGEG